jgi:hypothetical protein
MMATGEEPHANRGPAAPANALAQDGPRQGSHEKRIGCKDRVALDKAELHEGHDHDADLGGQKHAAEDLQERLRGRGGSADRAFAPPRQHHHEGGEEPVADHHHHEDVVMAGEVAADPVLHREDEGRGDHQPDAEAGIRLHQAFLARVICLLRP